MDEEDEKWVHFVTARRTYFHLGHIHNLLMCFTQLKMLLDNLKKEPIQLVHREITFEK